MIDKYASQKRVAMARGSVASGHSCGPKGGPGEGGVRKGRVQDCRRQRSQFLAALERAGSFRRWNELGVFFGVQVRPRVTQYLDSFQPWAREFPVERPGLHSGYLPPLGRRPEDGGGGGSRAESESASVRGGTVQSGADQRRGASETGTVPTARVRHKEQVEARCTMYRSSS